MNSIGALARAGANLSSGSLALNTPAGTAFPFARGPAAPGAERQLNDFSSAREMHTSRPQGCPDRAASAMPQGYVILLLRFRT